MSAKKTPKQERQDRALHNLRSAVEAGVHRHVRTAALGALKADCSDAELGRVVRLATLKDTQVAS
jgi:hypothetical protein